MKSLEQFCKDTIKELKKSNNKTWGTIFVERRMELSYNYLKGKVLSTSHGVNIFDNILKSLELSEEQGEYGDNFRSIIRSEIRGEYK